MKWGPKHLKSWHFSFFFHMEAIKLSFWPQHVMIFFHAWASRKLTLIHPSPNWATISSSNFPHFILHYRGFKLILSSFFLFEIELNIKKEYQSRVKAMNKICVYLQGRTKWRNCWLATKTFGWMQAARYILVNTIFILCSKILPTLPVT